MAFSAFVFLAFLVIAPPIPAHATGVGLMMGPSLQIRGELTPLKVLQTESRQIAISDTVFLLTSGDTYFDPGGGSVSHKWTAMDEMKPTALTPSKGGAAPAFSKPGYNHLR